MADISALGNLQSSEPLDLDMYADAKESTFRLPRKGRYTVKAPDVIPDSAFGATQAGFLKAQIDPTVIGPTNEGFQCRYTSVSAKPFNRSGQQVSQMADYLRACGVRGKIAGDPQALADAVAQTAGLTYEVQLDWRVFNRNTGLSVEGMENFPKDDKGEPQPWITDSGDIGDDGQPRRLRANVIVSRFYPAA
jgi:hypothetical protein